MHYLKIVPSLILYTIEYGAHYPNTHFNYAKLFMALTSVIGLRVRYVFYDKHDNYIKIDTEKTDLFLDKKLRIKERKALLKQNIAFILNDLNILSDKPQHLWIKLSENINTIISFKDIKTGIETINNMIYNIQKHLTRKELQQAILKIFKDFHWITIVDENTLSFQILLNEENKKEREIMNKTIANYSKMKEIDGIIYFE